MKSESQEMDFDLETNEGNVSPNSNSKQKIIPEKVAKGWAELPPKGKIAISVGAVATVGAGAIALLCEKTEYVELYSNLDYEQAGAIKTALEESGVSDYKIGENGTAILVPKERVDSLRMDLAVSGAAPVTGTGYELFDEASFGMTEEERSVLYQRALEGELRRSILTLSAVKDARVHLTLASDSVFLREPSPSSASVILELSSSLSLDKVEGIVALLSGAVQGLSTDNIQIIDTEGNLLNKNIGSEENNYPSTFEDRVSQEAGYESYLEDKLQEQLGKVFGYNKIAASVRVTLNQNSEEQKSEEYTEGAVVSEQNSFNRQEGETETDENGSPVDNNTQNVIEGTVQDAITDPGVIEYDSTTNYQPSVTETHTIKPPGEIENITVSVIYSGEINEALQEQIRNHAASIVGVKEGRGDVVSVAGIPFELPAIEEGVDLENQTSKERLYLYGAIAAVVLAGALIMSKRRKKLKQEELAYIKNLEEEEKEEENLENEIRRVMEEGTYLEKLQHIDEVGIDVVDLLAEFFDEHLSEGIAILQRWVREESGPRFKSNEDGKYDGIERTARLLIILGKEKTTEILKDFHSEETVKIAHIISGISSIHHDQILMLAEQFLGEVDEGRHSAYGGYGFAHDILSDTIGSETTNDILVKPTNKNSDKKPFDIIQNMDPQQLYNVLADEHPQTVAMVLCYLPSDKAAHIVSQFPPEMQAKLAQRVGMMNDTSAQIVETVERVIETRLQNLVSGQMSQVGGLGTIVDILNNVDRSTQKQILDNLEIQNPSLASDVLDNLFTFEDIAKLNDIAVQRIIREIDQSVLVLALKGATDEMMNLILSNTSQRAAERIKEDLEFLGGVKISEVEAAQRKIVDVVRTLEEKGEIQITQGGESDVIY